MDLKDSHSTNGKRTSTFPFIPRFFGTMTCFFGILFILFGDIKTPENFRILSDFIQNILLFNLILLIFMPTNRVMKIAIIIGVFTVIIDFILETVAVYLDWWYPLGGTQYSPIIVVPLEMVASFFLIGSTMAIILTFPEELRNTEIRFLRPFKIFVRNPNMDKVWRLLLILGNAIIGTNGDYTAGPTIWVPGPTWHPFYTFLVWFGGGFITLVLFYSLQNMIPKEED